MNFKVGNFVALPLSVSALMLSSSLAGQVKAFPARVTSQVMPPEGHFYKVEKAS